jgi:hypothetical protein
MQGLAQRIPQRSTPPVGKNRAANAHPLGLSPTESPQNLAKKKIPQTNAIFEHLLSVHAWAANEPETLRISIDSKAKVKIGPFSRGGYARSLQAVRAADHDMQPLAVLVPMGILEVEAHQLNILFGTSHETSDFIADALDWWWQNRRSVYPHVHRLLINLDNGPQIASSRTQFMSRLVDFSDQYQLPLELAYYPPYHSKYNPIERCWGVLENYWNGTLLSSIPTALEWAKRMTWRGVSPIVHLWDRVYHKGVRITKAAYRPIAARLLRAADIGKWSVRIEPKTSP